MLVAENSHSNRRLEPPFPDLAVAGLGLVYLTEAEPSYLDSPHYELYDTIMRGTMCTLWGSVFR